MTGRRAARDLSVVYVPHLQQGRGAYGLACNRWLLGGSADSPSRVR